MDLSPIPEHLRGFVVEQDYSRYTAEDQAIWRFAVLNTHARLLGAAHPAYAEGFDATGISVDRIPVIEDMSRCLERFGWRAVAVDGFIPPRAFQGFQAHGILPIAADIRTSEHLTYTPAPDIVHEAAGHAPFLAEPHYARYLRRIGAVLEKAFASRADRAVYDAIYSLSEIKEDPASTAAEVAAATRALDAATAAVSSASEAAKLSRLYWWTAEYGLVGTLDDYRLYGAGLLSSIGEGFFCRAPEVRKLPLDASCIDQDYDITRAQPQLFVARSFAHLEEVLDEVAAGLAHSRGGPDALFAARASEDVATVELEGGATVSGVVTDVAMHDGEPCLVRFSGSCAVGVAGSLAAEMPRHDGYALPLGVLEDGRSASSLDADAIAHEVCEGRLALRFASGLSVHGVVRALLPSSGRIAIVLLDEFRVDRRGEPIFVASGPYPLALSRRALTAGAGAPAGYFPKAAVSTTTVPKPRIFDATQSERQALHVRAERIARADAGSDVEQEVEDVAARLDEAFPDEWLLRWNLLEVLAKRGLQSERARRLEEQLERLELRFDRREPITTGLETIRALRRARDTGGGAREG